jgi:iron(III) transport system ATP-binding protein
VNVTVTKVHKGFGAHPVLKGVSLEAPRGTLTAVLGPSGSGKTTLLRALAGFASPEEGSIEIGGRVVDAPGTHVPPESRGIGYVPQEGSLFPHLDIAANIGFGLARRARGQRGLRKARVEELLELIGLSGLGHRYPHQLSGGQQQRVALARALAPSPALVLMDEPFSSLDAGLRASVRADVRGILKGLATTAILVTHDQDEALSMADQVVVLREGVVVQQGTPQQLYDNPADRSLAAFIGEANLLRGVLTDQGVNSILGTLATRSPAGLANGAQVTALIRPEQIRVLPEGAPGLAGRVVACDYFGHDTLLGIAPEGAGAAARDSGAEAPPLTVRTGYEGSLPLGARVSLAVTGPVTVWAAAAE